MHVCVKLLQSFLTLCNPMDLSPPRSSVHGIFQTIILEWVDMPSSRRYWTLGKLTILEEMGCTTALGLYLITTCCHANMPCLLPQASDDQMCRTCGKVHSFTHSLSKCFGGACLNKQIWRLTWFMSSASSPSANDAVHPNPLTTLSCLLTHSRFPPHHPACAHTMLLLLLLSR